MVTKTRRDINATKDAAKNKRSEEYNRAVVTVRQNQKEKEIAQGLMTQMFMQQQIEASKQALLDLAAKLDLQQRILDNKMKMLEMQQSGVQQSPPPLPGPTDILSMLGGQQPQSQPDMGAGALGAGAMGAGGGMDLGGGMPMPPGPSQGQGGDAAGLPGGQGGAGGVVVPQPPVM